MLEAARDLTPVLEALLFSSQHPLKITDLREALGEDFSEQDIQSGLEKLEAMLIDRGSSLTVRQIGPGYQLRTRPAYFLWVQNMMNREQETRLTQPGLETLAIIAYRQPIHRAEIEQIRGVNSEGVLKSLLDRRMIRLLGRDNLPGQPLLYGTSERFLEVFGLKTLDELPDLEELTEVLE